MNEYIIVYRGNGAKMWQGQKPLLQFLPDHLWAQVLEMSNCELYKKVENE